MGRRKRGGGADSIVNSHALIIYRDFSARFTEINGGQVNLV